MPSFSAALHFWFKLGWISFGGPAGQIAIMHQELVERKRWVSESQFMHALNYCMVLPGPEAQQLATYLGWLMHRSWGGICAGALFILPSLFILIFLSWVYLRFGDIPLIKSVFYVIKPAVTAIIAHACWRIGKRSLQHGLLISLAISSFVAIYFFSVPFPYIIFGAAVIGLVGSLRWPDIFLGVGMHAANASTIQPLPTETVAIVNKTQPTRGTTFLTIGIGLLLWLTPFAALFMLTGSESLMTHLAWFFTKAALLTFGGAYAVLPYVQQAAVDQYAWLTAAQMIDGLALGETTPGPLIMVVTFVGFVAGYQAELGLSPTLLGLVCALIVTWFTFLPSFLFVLVGAPLIEKTHHNPKIKGALTAITAAVVGVIFNLAVYFAAHTIRDVENQWDFMALTLTAVATALLFWGRVSVMQLIALYAALGALGAYIS